MLTRILCTHLCLIAALQKSGLDDKSAMAQARGVKASSRASEVWKFAASRGR
jgi:hypothetical protein